jgi:DNA-binding FrmR family transcriptional regulator
VPKKIFKKKLENSAGYFILKCLRLYKGHFLNFQRNVMNKCRDVRKKLSAFQDGEVNQIQKESIETHLRSCRECKKQFTAMMHTYQSIDKLPQIEPDPIFTQQVIARINKTSLQDHFLNNFLRPLSIPAAMVIIGLLSGTLIGSLVIQNQLNPLELSSPANYPDRENIVTSLSLDSFNAAPPGSIADGFLHVTLGTNMDTRNHGVSL